MWSGFQAKKLNTCRELKHEVAANLAEAENQAGLVPGPDPDPKKIWHFFWVRVRTRYKLSLVFRLSLVYIKFKFSAGIQLFGMKTTSYGKPDLKNSFPRSDLRCGDFRVRFRVMLTDFHHKKLTTRGVQGDVGIQGVPLPQPAPEPHPEVAAPQIWPQKWIF